MDQSLDQHNQQSEGQNPFPAQPAPQSGNIGPLAAAVVIVVLLAAGGFYFLYYSQQQTLDATPAPEQSAGGQDSVDSIEADLEATQTSGAETDVDNLNGAL